jgi:hypothetical protein
MPGNGKPFEKGDDRINYEGRPKKGDSWADVLAEALSEIDPDDKDRKTFKQSISRVLRQKGQEGSLKAIEMIMDRMDGKPSQKIEAEGDIKINSPMAEAIKALREKDAKN